MGRLQSDLSSGKAVRYPSQGPVEFQRSRVIEENIRKEEQYQDNISTALRQSRASQEALDETIDRLIDVKQIMVRGATGSTSSGGHDTMAGEIRGIRDTLINTLNVSSGDRFLFAGTNSSERPFELIIPDPADPDPVVNPGNVANNSNDKAPGVLVGDGVRLEIGISGVELRDTAAGDLFEILSEVITALEAGNSEEINGKLNEMDTVIQHVSNLTARLGTNINRMDFMFEQYESARITQQAEISNMVDTDYAQAFSDLQRNQVAYEAAMAVHATMFGNTLLDYL